MSHPYVAGLWLALGLVVTPALGPGASGTDAPRHGISRSSHAKHPGHAAAKYVLGAKNKRPISWRSIKLMSIPPRLSVTVGQTVTFYQLRITVRACVVRPADQPADSAAYLDIVDAHPTQPGFHGWMLSNEHAASMLQHPVYDVRVSGCH